MATLKDARQAYYDASGMLSTIVRQLSFAGIAVVWMLKNGKTPDAVAAIPFSKWLLLSLLLFVLSLAFDVLQYMWKTLIYGLFSYKKEQQYLEQGVEHPDLEEKTFLFPHYINVISLHFFWPKALFCLSGHVIMVIFIATKLI